MRVSAHAGFPCFRNAGFALVIALSVMAFALVLILALVGSVAVGQQGSRIAMQQVSARQNALISLQLAIGELQSRIGPDQRATASADILDERNNPYTLVWHSDPDFGWDPDLLDWNTGGAIRNHSHPLVSANPDTLSRLITGAGRFDEAVFTDPVDLLAVFNPGSDAPASLKGDRLPLTDTDSRVIGHCAWVAQDESLKANLSVQDAAQLATDHRGHEVDAGHRMALAETSRRLSVFPGANPAGVEIDGRQPFSSFDPQDATQAAARRKAAHLGNWISGGLLDPGDVGNWTDSEQIAPYRNHFTFYSRGVLADTKNGGLRRDLSRGLDDQYFEKLHNVPVFGADRNGNVIADGINQPVGDQWKFLRDYYQFYRPLDNGLARSLGDGRNTFHGVSDVTSANPNVRIRLTHEDIARGLNGMYSSARYTNETPPYSTLITPRTPAPRSNPGRDASVGENDWFLLTPQIRPVVLRNALKIGSYFEKITDVSHEHHGKYRLAVTSYPVLTLWNPFNVAIDLAPSPSANPMGSAHSLKLHQDANIELHLGVNRISGDSGENKLKRFQLKTIAPNVILNAGTRGVPSEMPPGAIWVLGLTRSHEKDIDADINNVELAPVSNSSSVSELNRIINKVDEYILEQKVDAYGNPVFNPDGSPKMIKVWKGIFEPSDKITLLEADLQNYHKEHRNEYRWFGQIQSGTVNHYCFNTGENSDLPKPYHAAVPLYLGAVETLDNEDVGLTPLVTIHFNANTTGQQDRNPAFPAFAQVNFLGANPLVVAEDDTKGDVKALYHRERSNATGLDFNNVFPEHDFSNGRGYYGKSFESGDGVTRITLYDLPRHPVISIADLKNLTLGWCEDTHARPIGASWPLASLRDLSDPYIRSVAPDGYGTNIYGDTGQYRNGAGCDTSYFYNEALFDAYFFSGIPSSERDGSAPLRRQTFPYGREFNQDYIDDNRPPANTRLGYYGRPTLDDLRGLANGAGRATYDGFEKAAAHLMIDGPFNINSTSPQAWQSILSGFRGLEIVGVANDYGGKVTYDAPGSAFVDNFVPSGDDNDLYAGHRRLNDGEVEALSDELVDEIRSRGIATTLGAFVNRDLNGAGHEQRMGRIDTAIRNAGLNDSPRTEMVDRYASNHPGVGAHLFGENLIEESAAGLPGYLKQQDILRPLTPVMTTRGDTFLIRGYGESIDPGTGLIEGRAWCEAIVQRVPDYVDETVDPWEPATGPRNEKFGRKLKIIRFRWISGNDLS